MVDAGGDLVASRGDHLVAVEAAGPVDLHRGTVRIPRGTRLDLGGIAKSWMAGRAAALLCARCDEESMMVDAREGRFDA